MSLRSSDFSLLLVSSVVVCVGAYCHLQTLSELRRAKRNRSLPRSSSSDCTATVGRPKKNRRQLVVDDLVCPITLELPFDPVTAEDGRVYERAAIEKHFATQKQQQHGQQGEIKSPLTNEKMGVHLLSAPQHRNIIEALIESGAMTGDLADKWMERAREKKTMEGLVKRANQNDVLAMEQVAINYFRGENGFKEDDQRAFLWFKRAHMAGSALGTAHMGYMLASGVGVTRNKKEGIVYLGIAAGRGSDMACYRLGMAWADGKYGLPANDAEAVSWLKLSLSGDCRCRTMNEKSTKRAQQKLEEVANRSSPAIQIPSS